jgi:hypothetical protein
MRSVIGMVVRVGITMLGGNPIVANEDMDDEDDECLLGCARLRATVHVESIRFVARCAVLDDAWRVRACASISSRARVARLARILSSCARSL